MSDPDIPSWEDLLDAIERLFGERHPDFDDLWDFYREQVDELEQDENHPYPDDWDGKEHGIAPLPLLHATISTASYAYEHWDALDAAYRREEIKILHQAREQWDHRQYCSNLN